MQRLVKLHISVVAARSNRLLSVLAWQDPTTLAVTVLPVYGATGRFGDLVLCDYVGTGTNLGWIVDQTRHFADVTLTICGIVLVGVDDRGQES